MSDTFELETDDAAVVLRDGELELIMPQFEDDEVVPDDYLIFAAFMIGFQEPEFRSFMLSLFSDEMRSH